MQEHQFAITQKGRAYIDAAMRPTGGCAPWVTLDARRAWGLAEQPRRVAAASPLQAA